MKLKGVSTGNSQVSTPFYSTKAETSANEEEEDTRSICPYDSDFPPIENPIYQNQLRVLKFLNESFEMEMVSLFKELMLAKNRDKRQYYQSTFTQSEKDRVKRK